MLKSLPGFLEAYWLYLVVGAAVIAVISRYSKKFSGYMKKALLLLAAVLLIFLGYELVTGKSILTLPGRIDKKFSEKPKNPETGRRYYKSYEERYGDREKE